MIDADFNAICYVAERDKSNEANSGNKIKESAAFFFFFFLN